MNICQCGALIIIFIVALFSSMPYECMAGCGANFDKMKKRRIEAIRGQILSKLGLTQLPQNDAPQEPPTREVEALYNRTRDFVQEQARIKREKCEYTEEDKYYAQDITTVYMKSGKSHSRDSGNPARGYEGTYSYITSSYLGFIALNL